MTKEEENCTVIEVKRAFPMTEADKQFVRRVKEKIKDLRNSNEKESAVTDRGEQTHRPSQSQTENREAFFSDDEDDESENTSAPTFDGSNSGMGFKAEQRRDRDGLPRCRTKTTNRHACGWGS